MARILLVDDAKFMRATLTNMLTKAGHDIVGEGMNGIEAVEMYHRLKPDLAIMDITMPQMNGIDAVKAIRSEFPQAKIIMCSAMGQQRMIVEAIKSGAKDFIVKPFVESAVLDAINRILS
ncbi:response regulator [Bacillus benzoevorans]|uniref:Two-component system chemotaxis response regulator CheY n=1 Tax=Bacillus benzoevorans TaxID=1456 RepID=A0A7X0LTR3_9BACI|nr:response regulator [Bacillus benzoevorans]MBB6444161.1 two-component system chemotaxis response regulator CheY [Bacillus benzoevorans]